MSLQANRRRLLCGVAVALMGALFLLDPVLPVLHRGEVPSIAVIALSGFLAPFHLGLVVAGVIGLTQILRERSDKAGLIGGALTVMGWAVGVRILGLGQLESLLATGVTGLPPDTLAKLFEAAPVVWVSIVPMGLLFPAGVITLGAALFVTRAIPRWISLLFTLGGLIFPVGRIFKVEWAILSCDLLFGVSLILIGWQILTRRDLWSSGSSSAPPAEVEESRLVGAGSTP